jgi:[ribosomal protein S18]-alanine N-acetyltransferase
VYVRRYRPEDLDAIYRLDVACFAPQFRFSRGLMRQVVTARSSVTLLACQPKADGGEDLLGFCAWNLRRTGKTLQAYLATLDVRPSDQRRGIGRLLMHTAEETLTAQGCSVIYLHVYVENDAACALYASLGYSRVRREADFYGAGTDAWLYVKELPPRQPQA